MIVACVSSRCRRDEATNEAKAKEEQTVFFGFRSYEGTKVTVCKMNDEIVCGMEFGRWCLAEPRMRKEASAKWVRWLQESGGS
jgi:hypothetical protein